MPRRRVTAPPPQRFLRVYAFDPSSTARLDNTLVIQVPYEPLTRGPVGRKIAVIDYDATNRCYYEAIDLNDSASLGQQGRSPSEADPQFHQQMVYAVVMDTIRRFEVALGREVRWRRDTRATSARHHGLLRIYPHAMQEANAYYDPQLRALLFGYFRAEDDDVGASLPGQVVFTCLSHDIIVHETTHAILDGIREYFGDPTGPDAGAFHEGFADIVALLQHFSFKDSLLETIQRTGGLIHRRQLTPAVLPEAGSPAMIQAELGEDNPMVDLARQFGEAMGHRKALRSALGTTPDPRALDSVTEPHQRGAILVAAVFDAFFSCYIERTRDLIRMAYPDGREIVPNFLHADLANRLAEEAARIAGQIQNICLRALDYCPPVDITFGDYLRALVTADREVMADDGRGYRRALIAAFRARGIRPEGVLSYSEDALVWDRYDGAQVPPKGNDEARSFHRLWSELNRFEDEPGPETRQALYRQLWGAAKAYHLDLGLSSAFRVQAKSINTLQRVRPDGSLQRQIVAELVQQRQEVPVNPNRPGDGSFTFRGGTTTIISRQGEVRYAISKPIDGAAGEERLRRQRAYLRELRSAFQLAPYVAFDALRDYGLLGIHRGY
jgi:hypothetical protein